jgi:hypothetical protein
VMITSLSREFNSKSDVHSIVKVNHPPRPTSNNTNLGIARMDTDSSAESLC